MPLLNLKRCFSRLHPSGIGVLGILANAASPSSNERWNVIPAFFITIAFYRMLKPNLKK